MPANYPEMWQARVERNINDAVNAPWLDGIPEMDTAVIEMGSGTATETNIIHISNTDFSPDVLINNTAYPLALQAYTDSESTIALDKFSSLPTTLTDDQVMGASYNRIDAATASHTEAIVAKKNIKAAHAIAPAGNTVATPVILVTGTGTEVSGERLHLIYDNLVALKAYCDGAKPRIPSAGRRLVLCDDHWNDLLLDRKNFGDQLINYQEGAPAPRILGFEIYRFAENPSYNSTTKAKLAFGSTPSAGQYQASFVFVVKNIAKKTGYTKQYFSPASLDATNQVNKVAYRHYFLAVNKRIQHCAAILSINKA